MKFLIPSPAPPYKQLYMASSATDIWFWVENVVFLVSIFKYIASLFAIGE